jgi:integrase/recombinase XerD
MANIKVVLRSEKKKDGTFPLAIRITKDRKSSFIYLDYSIREDEWDAVKQRVKKSHANSTRLNNYLLKKLSEATDSALEAESNKSFVSARSVKQKIKPTTSSTFIPQAEAYLARLKQAGKYNQYNAEKSRIKHFKEFMNGIDIAFPEITPPFLERFKAYLIGRYKMSERSAINHFVMVRSVFSQAINDNIVDSKFYPFGKGKVKIKFPDSIKIGLTIEEVKQLEDVLLTDKTQNHARNVWLTSFYFAGMRISDVLRLRWSDLKDERLHYTMGKNNKGGSFKISEKAKLIFNQYKAFQQNANDLIFPDLKDVDFENKFLVQRKISNKTNLLDRTLRLQVAPVAGIDKKLTMHIARHTFGNISGDKIPIQMLQRLYRHTSITTTIGYQSNFINKDTDDALSSVLNY